MEEDGAEEDDGGLHLARAARDAAAFLFLRLRDQVGAMKFLTENGEARNP